MAFNVLLIGKETKQTENYATLIRDMVDCHIDVMSRAENAMNWLARVRYHLVVMDLTDPIPHLEKIKRVHPESSVIVITEKATIEESVKALRTGAEDYLKKPIHVDSFRLAVRRGIDRKALFDEDGVYSGYLNLVNSCQMISASIDESRVFSIVKSYLSRELKTSQSGVFLLKDDGTWQLHGSEDSAISDQAFGEVLDIAVKSAELPKIFKNEESLFYHWVDRNATTPSIFAMPFKLASEKPYYFVCIAPKKPEPFQEFESRLKILRAQIEVTGQNILRYRDVQEMAYVDDLTGLHNTRYLATVLEREIEKAKLNQAKFAVLFVDADKFKNVNDQHGHVHGSKLLHELGQKLKTFVRDSDHIVRYGGDEFVAILTPADLQAGKAVAERIRREIEKTEFLKADGLKLKITVSIGVAIFPDHASLKDEIIEAADHAMYAAKSESRNRVFVAEIPKERGHV